MAYENFMCNKDFHPSNFRNLRKMYEAEERQKAEEKRQEELRQQYLKEQELYKSKELMGRANPLGFMYEPPPGYVKDEDKSKTEGDQLQLKFDWQKPGRAAPREDYAKGMELQDKPFGIEVRNVKCVKCGKWGHVNTDKECPLYGKARPQPTDGEPVRVSLPDLDTVEDGLIFKQCVKDRVVNELADNQQLVLSGEEEGGEVDSLLAGFSKKERRKILKKLAKMESEEQGGGKKKHKRKRRRHSDRGSSDEEGGRESNVRRRRREDSDSDSSSEGRRRQRSRSRERNSRHKSHKNRSKARHSHTH